MVVTVVVDRMVAVTVEVVMMTVVGVLFVMMVIVMVIIVKLVVVLRDSCHNGFFFFQSSAGCSDGCHYVNGHDSYCVL